MWSKDFYFKVVRNPYCLFWYPSTASDLKTHIAAQFGCPTNYFVLFSYSTFAHAIDGKYDGAGLDFHEFVGVIEYGL